MKKFLQILFHLILIFEFTNLLYSQKQGQERLDSLLKELEKIQADSIKVNLLNDIAFEYNTTNPNLGITFAQKGLKLAEKIKYLFGVAKCYNSIGVCYWAKSDYVNALDAYFKSIEFNEKIKNKSGLASNFGNIGLIYQEQAEYSKALEYFQIAMKINQTIGSKKGLASNLGLIGNLYSVKENYSEALNYYFKALELNQELNLKNGEATNLVNIGRVYMMTSEFNKALEYFFKSLKLNQELNRERGIMYNFGYIGQIYLKLSDEIKNENVKFNNKHYSTKNIQLNKSIEYSLKAVTISKKIKANKELIDWYGTLSEAYLKMYNWEKAYYYADSSHKMQDSIFSQESRIKLFNLESKRNNEIEKREKEIKRKQQLLIYYSTGIGILVLFGIILFVIRERRKAEKLLLNILPKEVERRLKKKEKYIADHFDEASVIFIDISQFTALSKGVKPEKIVEMLNGVYTEFDHIASKYGLEKIKTIGDCYMAACGIPVKNEKHTELTAKFALEAMKKMNGFEIDEEIELLFKVGIDCGPVVAGVIGEKKFIYDLWGDTVNTANRMQEYSEPGKIQVTDRFQKKLSQEFSLVERGEIDIKGKGLMKTYYLLHDKFA